ncbi:FUSC family protein [Hutsoniella sourekii]
MKWLKDLFKVRPTDQPLVKFIGAGLATALPLLIGYFIDNPVLGSMGAIGGFVYLSIENRELSYLAKKLTVVAVIQVLVVGLGLLVAHHAWFIPLLISSVAFLALLTARVLEVPNPGAFFIIMTCSMACGMKVSIDEIPLRLFYLAIGGCISVMMALLVTKYMQEQLKMPPFIDSLSARDHIRLSIQNDPIVFVNTILHASIIFLITYIAMGVGLFNPFWATILALAVLSPRDVKLVLIRSSQRIIGSLVGVVAGSIFLSIDVPDIVTILTIGILTFFVEYFMVRNYALANFFTNPTAILLAHMGGTTTAYTLLSTRILAIILGSSLAFVSLFLMTAAFDYYRNHIPDTTALENHEINHENDDL